MYGMQTALHYYFPQIKTQGIYQMPKLIVFTSSHVNRTSGQIYFSIGNNFLNF